MVSPIIPFLLLVLGVNRRQSRTGTILPLNQRVQLRIILTQEGLEAFRAQKVDCVVLDLDFRDSSGFQFLLDVVPNRDRPEIAIVFLTRLFNPTLREMAVHNGAQAYLVKQSTSADQLDKVIQEAVSAVRTH